MNANEHEARKTSMSRENRRDRNVTSHHPATAAAWGTPRESQRGCASPDLDRSTRALLLAHNDKRKCGDFAPHILTRHGDTEARSKSTSFTAINGIGVDFEPQFQVAQSGDGAIVTSIVTECDKAAV